MPQVYRLVLSLACAYNVAFGLWAGLRPRSFFEVFGMEPPRYPSLWACLGMVVGVYGLAYGYAALRLDRARPLVAIGLLGKVLGPIGWCLAVREGELPLSTFTMILLNDVVWWLPFSLFLLEGTALGAGLRRWAPALCAILNALAGLAMLILLRPGTELVPDLAQRAAYIRDHPLAWRAGWAIWIAAALSLAGFYAWWGARVPRRGLALAAMGVTIAGLACDMFAESLLIAWLPERMDLLAPLCSLLTGGAANGLYTVAGTMLTLAGPLPPPLGAWAWATWACGYALSAFTLLGSPAGVAVSTAALLVLFCPFAWTLGRRLELRASRPPL